MIRVAMYLLLRILLGVTALNFFKCAWQCLKHSQKCSVRLHKSHGLQGFLILLWDQLLYRICFSKFYPINTKTTASKGRVSPSKTKGFWKFLNNISYHKWKLRVKLLAAQKSRVWELFMAWRWKSIRLIEEIFRWIKLMFSKGSHSYTQKILVSFNSEIHKYHIVCNSQLTKI